MLDIVPQLAVNSLISGSIYALVALGMALTYQNLKILNFAHGHLMMLGGYLFMLTHVDWELGLAASAVVTALMLILLSAGVLAFFIRPFLRFNPLLVLVTTMSLSTIIESIVAMWFGVNVKSPGSLLDPHSIEFGGVYITELQLVIIAVTLSLLCLAALVIHCTSSGRLVRALSENSAVVESFGASASKTSYIVFASSVVAAGLAGVLIGYETNLTPGMGTPYTIKALAAILLGGLGSIWGTIAGAYVLGTIENFSIGLEFWGHSLPAGYKDAFAFVAILLVLLLKPQGIFGRKGRAA